MGRSARADYKIVAKSYARIGNAYKAQGKLDEAIRAWEDSLMEDRTADIEAKLKKAQKEKKDNEVNAHLYPEIAEQVEPTGA